ncbi:serine/threonine protein kinase [Nocardia coubleae]|uniref:non-specific serine/threonine protein kinase n=2 Tax=Nocardia coubleae TaxID=356147 RepID=A0A846WE47_9NOCA|nr:serine/threonine protein kinase [Nocardia coubleae]
MIRLGMAGARVRDGADCGPPTRGTKARARFEREADLAARLDHPNIVTVYDRGVDGNRPWIAMQYVPGTDAATVGVLEPLRAVRIVSEVAEALDFAHSRGVLHRDVKPANVLLGATEQGRPERVLLADFGIARLHFDQNPLTQTGTFTATLAYASPEQLAGSAVGPQCDQYSLACTLFVLLTGAPPFAANNPVAVIQSHMSADPPAITLQRPDLPAGLDHVLRRAMAKRPEDQFGSCGEFAGAVRSAFQPVGAEAGFGTSTAARRIAVTMVSPVPAPRPSRTRETRRPDRRAFSGAAPNPAHRVGRCGDNEPRTWALSWPWRGSLH